MNTALAAAAFTRRASLTGAEPNSGAKRRQYRFGVFTLDLDLGVLRRGDEEVALRPKSFEVLAYLLERNGRLVSREELMGAVWPQVAVTDEAVTKCIGDIRRAVEGDAPQLIRTIARRGYVFTGPVSVPAVEFPRKGPREAEQGPTPVAAEAERAPQPDQRNPVRLSRSWAMALIAILFAAGLFVLAFRPARPGSASRSAALDYTALTNFTDSAFAPALSPDGRMLAFIRGDTGTTLGGKGEIFIKLLPDGEPVRLTHDGKLKMSPVFTPGGDRVAYSLPAPMNDATNWSTWTVSVFGGEPRLLLSNASGTTWIPGATPPRLLFSQVDRGSHMSIVTSAENGTESRTVYAPGGWNEMAHRSFLSPDRKRALVVEMDGGGWRPCRLVPFVPGGTDEKSLGGGESVGPSPGQCSSAAWSPDGKWIYLSVNTGNGYHIWRQRFPGGAPEQVTFGATEELEIVFAPDGQSFLTSVGTRQSTLWIHDAQGERQVTSEGYATLPRFSPDGKKLYFLLRSRSNRRFVSGELWVANLETSDRERLLADFLLEHYSISQDGSRIVFAAISESGESRVWLARLDGRTPPRRLSMFPANRAFFGAGDDVFFQGTEDGDRRFMYRIREDGSGFQKVIPDPIISAYDASPDGNSLAVWPGSAVQVFPTSGGPPIDVSTVCAAAGGENRGITPPCVSWSPNGKFLYLNDRNAGQIYALPIPSGRNLPPLPAGGITSEMQAAALPGARTIRERHAFVGSEPSVYAFFRVTSQRNIYRVRVP